MGHIDEELRSSSVCLACIGHGQGARRVRVLGDVLILDVATTGACLSRPCLQVLEAAIWRSSCSSPGGFRIL